MAELDYTLIQEAIRRLEGDGLYLSAQAIIAALEERERLREANEVLRVLLRATEQKCSQLKTIRLAAQAWADARFHGRHELPQVKALIAALAAVPPKNDEEAALEGRDG